MPRVSVVVPNYNHAAFLRQRLDTVLAQTFQDFELILLDDASKDASRAILREYQDPSRSAGIDVRMDGNEANSGSPFKQWNKGVRMARGEYIWIAESDDYADARLLERLVAILEASPDVSFAYCRSWRVNERGDVDGFADACLPDPERWRTDFCMDGREMCRVYFSHVTPVRNASSVVFRREVYERVGGADETFRLGGDWKLWAATALQGKVAYLSEPLNYHRFHSGTARSQIEAIQADSSEILRICNWIIRQLTLSPAELEHVLDVKAGIWVPALLSLKTPLSLKRELLREVRALDPYPWRRVMRPALKAVRMNLHRSWHDLRSRLFPTGRPA
ncbi:MAG TPA: glycosyltransferase [Candidatus Acidoferrales bacterium]|nr:glycosyltransferase [Candidatus Acidoferrales bacterium]